MIRRIEQTVRFPVARMAPTARNWALTQVRLENSGAKAAKEATISGGRSTAVVSRGDGSSTTVDPGQRPPGSASQLGQSRVTGRVLHLMVHRTPSIYASCCYRFAKLQSSHRFLTYDRGAFPPQA